MSAYWQTVGMMKDGYVLNTWHRRQYHVVYQCRHMACMHCAQASLTLHARSSASASTTFHTGAQDRAKKLVAIIQARNYQFRRHSLRPDSSPKATKELDHTKTTS